jgi:hypothetical protein
MFLNSGQGYSILWKLNPVRSNTQQILVTVCLHSPQWGLTDAIVHKFAMSRTEHITCLSQADSSVTTGKIPLL